jgi:integrase
MAGGSAVRSLTHLRRLPLLVTPRRMLGVLTSTTRNFNRSFYARITKASVRRISPHGARRTCGTLLVDLDVHPRVIMQILRHADFAVTMEIYSPASSKATQKALKRLGKSLDG